MPSYRSNKPVRPRVALTIGDPFGIGPEISLKAAASRRIRSLADFIIIGDATVLSAALKVPGAPRSIPPGISVIDPRIIAHSAVKFGTPSRVSGAASLAYLDIALKIIKDGQADCLVNAPLSKEAVASTGIDFIGHTEYIAKSFKIKDFAMMLIGGPLKVTLVTRHIPLKSVPKAATAGEITKAVELSREALVRSFGIKDPKIGVASINPHGGEGGKIGREEVETVIPAVAAMKRKYRNIIGPSSSEALFYMAYRGKLDCVVAMYHDQGLTPLKMIARDKSINITLGLPFVRTSPGHGTAFDIAGKGIAEAAPLEESIRLAVALCKKGK